MKVVTVGGSISGLMHGVVLKALGHKVHILEAREPNDLVNQAAGLALGSQAQELMKAYVPNEVVYCMKSSRTQWLDADSSVIVEYPLTVESATSSWGLVYSLLKKTFLQKGGPTQPVYETGQRVTGLVHHTSEVTVICNDVNGVEKQLSADLVIGADGGRSFTRSIVEPEASQSYAGYIAWRGDVAESAVPSELNGVQNGSLIMTRADNSYILAYLTPSEDGQIEPGVRRFEWTWFDYCDDSSSDFRNIIMTDLARHKHNRVVPKGLLAKGAFERCITRAQKVLPSPWFEVISKAENPFVTAITDSMTSKAIHYDGKLLLTGDALIQFRPHMGLASNFAALQALGLSRVLSGENPLEEWEKEVLGYGQTFAQKSIAFGAFGLTGQWPEGYVHYKT